MNKFIILFFVMLVFPVLVHAQGVPASTSNQPIEITADGTLEWLRNKNMFVARKNAMAEQGDVSIKAATLSADYRETPASSMDIYKMRADDDVVIHNRESRAYGDNATYNVDTGLAVMTGDALKLVSTDQTLTARDRFEYWAVDGKMIAIGAARLERPKLTGGTDVLEADTITAFFENNQKGERVLQRMEAAGNVVITTPTEVITGAFGVYKAASNIANLSGGVTIRRGQNILEGERAEVDLNTNTSKMFSGNRSDERVRGVFYPGSDKKEQ